MPIGTPRPSEIETDTTPARIEARAPQMTRESTSRPSSSEPKRCARLGAPRTSLQLVARGSCGAIHGAANAIRTKNATIASPKSAPTRWRKRLQVLEVPPSSLSGKPRRPSMPHPRVDHEVREVGEEVERKVGGGRA
jgi:hypothetical protein